jgi:hypothetical protein
MKGACCGEISSTRTKATMLITHKACKGAACRPLPARGGPARRAAARMQVSVWRKGCWATTHWFRPPSGSRGGARGWLDAMHQWRVEPDRGHFRRICTLAIYLAPVSIASHSCLIEYKGKFCWIKIPDTPPPPCRASTEVYVVVQMHRHRQLAPAAGISAEPQEFTGPRSGPRFIIALTLPHTAICVAALHTR